MEARRAAKRVCALLRAVAGGANPTFAGQAAGAGWLLMARLRLAVWTASS